MERWGPVDAGASPHAVLRPLALSAVRLRGGFWESPRRANAGAGLREGLRQLHATGSLRNFELVATGGDPREHRDPVFRDSDVYKWLEAAAWQLAEAPDAELGEAVSGVVAIVAAAQAPDGYLNTHFQLVEPDRRWTWLDHSHELYCAGHLIQAAVAHHRATGRTELLDVARRAADNAGAVFVPGGPATDGHPEIETAFVELFRCTGDRRYLALAGRLLDARGAGRLGPGRHGGAAYFQDHAPVREARTVQGHAVRQVYLGAGVVDAYLETGERALLDASVAQWRDMTGRKMYVTGGIGAQHAGEAFGEPYELPNERAYAETCAAIGSIMWSWRLLLATGEGRFADVIERTLYNGFLSGVSLGGDRFFYVNPLLSHGTAPLVGRKLVERTAWFECACCPPNVMRLLASLPHYVATSAVGGVQIHQFVPATIAAGPATLRIETAYPWEGEVTVTVEASAGGEWELALRVPGWADRVQLDVDGEEETPPVRSGYARLRRTWRAGDAVRLRLPVAPRLTTASARVDAARGCVAVERGPLVYCLEEPDQADGVDPLTVRLSPGAPLRDEWRPDVLGGVVTVEAAGISPVPAPEPEPLYRPLGPPERPGAPVRLRLVPYYAWANRGPSRMRVWIPVDTGVQSA